MSTLPSIVAGASVPMLRPCNSFETCELRSSNAYKNQAAPVCLLRACNPRRIMSGMRPVLTHVALNVKDLSATVRFYETMCELHCVHRRGDPSRSGAVSWLAEHGREREFIMVLISGGPTRSVQGNDFSHLGFALESREA